ncbi:hypothetical protein AgCh_011684 [Apium graveolens]
MNVDGGCIENLGACVWVVFRGEDGKVRLAVSWKMEECWSHLIAEAKAILLGIQAAVEFGYTRVVVKSDCLNIINVISAQERGISSFHLIIDDIIHENRKKDKKATYFIYQAVNEVIFERISTASTSKDAWDIPNKAYKGEEKVKMVRFQALREEEVEDDHFMVEDKEEEMCKVKILTHIKEEKEELVEVSMEEEEDSNFLHEDVEEKDENEKRGKLDDKSKKYIFVGYSEASKAYKLYNPIIRKIVISRDVIFNEEASWKWKNEKERSSAFLDDDAFDPIEEEGSTPPTPPSNSPPNSSSSPSSSESLPRKTRTMADLYGETRRILEDEFVDLPYMQMQIRSLLKMPLKKINRGMTWIIN